MFNFKKYTLIFLLCSAVASPNPYIISLQSSFGKTVLALRPWRRTILACTGLAAGMTAGFLETSIQAFRKYKKITSPLLNPDRDQGDPAPYKKKYISYKKYASITGTLAALGTFLLYKTANPK